MKSLLDSFGRLIVLYRWLALLIIVALSALSLWVSHVRVQEELPVDFTPQAIFMDNSASMQRLREIETSFGREDNDFLVMLHGKALQTPEAMRLIRTLHKQFETVKAVERVDSLFSATRAISTDGFTLEAEPIWSEDHTSTLQKAIGEPYFQHALIANDQKTTVIRVRIEKSRERVSELQPIVSQLEKIVAQQSLPNDLRILTTGIPKIRTEVIELMMHDNFFYVPVLSVVFLLTIIVLFRSIRLSIAPLTGVLTAVIWSIGLLLWGGVTFNILSMLIPILGLIIGLADGIHLVTRYQEELHQDNDPVAAMGRCLQSMTVACFLTSFTTAAGFFSLLVAKTTVIQDFGLHCAISVLVAYIAVIFTVPTYLAFIPQAAIGTPVSQNKTEKAIFDSIDRQVRTYPKRWIGLVLGISLLATLIGRQVEPNSSILEMYHPDHPTYESIQLAEQRLSGIVPIFWHFESEKSLLEPEIFRKVQQLEQETKKWDFVKWTYSYPGQIQAVHQLITQKDTLPEDRALLHQLAFMTDAIPDIPLDRIRMGDKQMRILMLCTDAGGREYLRMVDDLLPKAEALFADQDVHIDFTGDGLMASIGIDHLINDLFSSLGLVFIVIMLTMLMLLRDWRLALIATIPNTIPLLFTLATLYVIDSDLQASNIVSFSVSVGLAVDDTIHFIVRYKQELQNGRSPQEAITYSYYGAGHAIILTSILLVSGFAILTTSLLSTTFHFGLLASITLASAILADLFLLPAMLHWKHNQDHANDKK